MARDHEALLALIEARRDVPFAWGSSANDCASFAAAAVAAQTGMNPLGDLRWADEAGAYDVIEGEGGLAAAVSARLREIAPAMAQRGDVGGVMIGNQIALLVVEGATLVGPAPRRQMRLPRSAMIVAWSAT